MAFQKSEKTGVEYKKGLSLHVVVLVFFVIFQYAFTYADKSATARSLGSVSASEFYDGTEIGEDDIYAIAEIMPVFPGGELAMRKFIAKAIKYPNSAMENGIQGRVFVKFVINKDGIVSDAKIARGVDPSIDKEAIRVIMSLPKWKPGIQNGVAVNVSLMFPITFQLQ